MSFTGDLEHLPIVDVIQLLHATKKSGTLNVRGRKGESQLVFDSGYIISANHLNDSVRIGNILVGTGAIAAEELDRSLRDQKNAGAGRKPLIAMLIEKGMVKKEAAFKALETLIELTIVEILTWTTGTFSLEVDRLAVSDEYRYFPEKLNQDMHLNTQNILMDALRIYDEKKRDGELTEEEPAEGPIAAGDAGGDASENWSLSADDLGLADLDRLERKIPGVFATLEDIDPVAIQREKIRSLAPGLSGAEQEELLAYLLKPANPSAGPVSGPGSHGQALILFSSDELLTFSVATACKKDGLPVFSTNDEQDIDLIIDQSLAKKITPVLVLDSPGTSPDERADLVRLRRQKMEKYPRVVIVQLASPRESGFYLQSFAEGIRAVFPRPEGRESISVSDLILFLEGLRSNIMKRAAPPSEDLFGQLRSGLDSLYGLKEAPEVVFALLTQVARCFERSVTLVVGQGELVAERGIGVKGEKSAGATAPLGFRIPLAPASIFKRVIEEGTLFCGECSDEVVRQHLFKEIGLPLRPAILLLPVRSRGKTVALTYADFGNKEVEPVSLELLKSLAAQAGLVMENVFYRKKLEKNPQ